MTGQHPLELERGGIAAPRAPVNYNQIDRASNFIFIEVRFNLDKSRDIGGRFLEARMDVGKNRVNKIRAFQPSAREHFGFGTQSLLGANEELIFPVPRELSGLREFFLDRGEIQPFAIRVNPKPDVKKRVFSEILGVPSHQIIDECVTWSLFVPLSFSNQGVYRLKCLPRLVIDSGCDLLWIAFGAAALWRDKLGNPFINMVFKGNRFGDLYPHVLCGTDDDAVACGKDLVDASESGNCNPIPDFVDKIIRCDGNAFIYRQDEERSSTL